MDIPISEESLRTVCLLVNQIMKPSVDLENTSPLTRMMERISKQQESASTLKAFLVSNGLWIGEV